MSRSGRQWWVVYRSTSGDARVGRTRGDRPAGTVFESEADALHAALTQQSGNVDAARKRLDAARAVENRLAVRLAGLRGAR